MDLDAALLAVSAVVVGAVLTFIFGMVQEGRRRRWARVDAEEAEERSRQAERQRRIEERAEEAANLLLGLFDSLAERLRPIRTHDADIPEVDDVTSEIRRLAVQLGDPEVRRRVEGVARATDRNLTIRNWEGDLPAVVMVKLHPIARNALGRVLSGEALGDATQLDHYLSAVDEYDEEMDRAYREDREERLRGN